MADTPHPDFEQIYQQAFASYTERMESTSSKPRQVGILILDEDAQSAAGIRQLLDSEGWRVDIVADVNALLDELRSGEWTLVIANIAMTGVDSAAYLNPRLSAVPEPRLTGALAVR